MRRALRACRADIHFGSALEESAAAPYASTVRDMWGNLPRHIRRSLKKPVEHAAAEGSVPSSSSTSLVQKKYLAPVVHALGSWAPQSWQPPLACDIYPGIPLKPYQKGQTSAYHYPTRLIPRELSRRIPMDLDVEPVFQTSDPAQIMRTRQSNLFRRLQDKVSCLLVFSGQPLSGLCTGVQLWRDGWTNMARKDMQFFRLHMCDSWWSRRTSSLTKFTLRRQVETDELCETFVYRGRWTLDIVDAIPYNQDVPTLLLVDRLGYIRWHAVGLPTTEALEALRPLIPLVASEKRR